MHAPAGGTRGAAAALAGVLALGAAFAAGTAVGGSGAPAATSRSAAPGVLDDAASQIASSGLEPVDRDTLDSAAIAAMLQAAGDRWGSWAHQSRPSARPPAVAAEAVRTPAGGQTVTRITVPAFARGVGRAVRVAVHQARSSRSAGVVLDLRGNPGGLLDEAVETASAFLGGGPVVSYSRRGGAPVQLDAIGTGDAAMPLVVLVDGGTASAAEVVAGALQDRGRAVLVGSRTFGKATVQEPRRLADGSSLELTVARYRTPSGRVLDGLGLVPDIEVAPGAAPDVAVRRAVQVLSGLVADNTPVSGGHR